MGISILTVIVHLLISLVTGCPSKASIAPHCICRDSFGGNQVFCNGIYNPTDLIIPVRAIAESNTQLMSISIDNSSLMYIPSKLFQGMYIEKIRFLTTELMALSDSDFAFEGLEDTLTEIRATDAHYIAQWDWQQLGKLRALELIDVNWIVLGSIADPFPELPKLTHLGIIRAEISHIVDNAFANLYGLRIISMKENDITELKRNMFPNPAPYLDLMDFSDNELSHLPEDFFDGMPNLDIAFFQKNYFVTLPEQPFGVAFDRLGEFFLTDNPIRCDCRVRWIVGRRTPLRFRAICSSPQHLKGWEIQHVDLKSLWC